MPDVGQRVLIDRNRIAGRVRELGTQLVADLRMDRSGAPAGAGSLATEAPEIVLVPVLTGALMFAADLVRAMDVRMSIRPIHASSYIGRATESSGQVHLGELPRDLRGRHVLIVDDILDTGLTLSRVRDAIAEQEPASLRICVLLSKERRREADVDVKYVGFVIPDEFVVGYGLDYDGLYRNIPDILVFKERGP